MKHPLLALAACLSAAGLSAQSPLDVFPTGAATFGWNQPPAIHTNYFDLTVASTITLQTIATPVLMAAGQVGTLEVWLTNPGTTTYVGNTGSAAVWSLAASGTITGVGTIGTPVSLTATSCQSINGGGLVVAPGSYGVMLRYTNGANPLLHALPAPQTFSNAELTVSGGAIQYVPFGALVGPAQGFTAWGWRGSISYQNGVAQHACATATKYGNGCYTVNGSAFQEWTDTATPSAAAAASAALTGRSLTFIPSAGGYVMTAGTAAGFITPSPAATSLPANDDGETAIPLTTPLAYPGGTTSQLFVHSNGYVSVGSNNTLPGGPNWVPEIPGMLAAPNAAWWSWHDYNPTEAGSGTIKWEEIGSLMVITWDNVESYPTGTANPSRLQFQFDEASGQVQILWQTIESVGGTGVLQGSDHIIGFSPGGASPSVGQFDIATLVGVQLNFPERTALSLAASAKPLIGSTITLDTTEAPSLSIGICFLSVVQIPAPGFDLALLGAPGCAALIDVSVGTGSVISNLLPGLSMSVPFAIPNLPGLVGFQCHAQSVWLDPAVNPFGALTSNGVALQLGTL